LSNPLHAAHRENKIAVSGKIYWWRGREGDWAL